MSDLIQHNLQEPFNWITAGSDRRSLMLKFIREDGVGVTAAAIENEMHHAPVGYEGPKCDFHKDLCAPRSIAAVADAGGVNLNYMPNLNPPMLTVMLNGHSTDKQAPIITAEMRDVTVSNMKEIFTALIAQSSRSIRLNVFNSAI